MLNSTLAYGAISKFFLLYLDEHLDFMLDSCVKEEKTRLGVMNEQ